MATAKVPHDKTDDVSPLDTYEKILGNLSITTDPVVIVGVNRKVNIGNYENIDITVSLAMPVTCEDQESLKEALERIAEEGMKFASQETFKRYQSIKNLASGE